VLLGDVVPIPTLPPSAIVNLSVVPKGSCPILNLSLSLLSIPTYQLAPVTLYSVTASPTPSF
jgi:hypothetical protein